MGDLLFFGKNVKFRQNSFTSAVIFAIIYITGCGSAWLEHLIWDQEVAGSNPVTQMKVVRGEIPSLFISIHAVFMSIHAMYIETS